MRQQSDANANFFDVSDCFKDVAVNASLVKTQCKTQTGYAAAHNGNVHVHSALIF
jgi:hypothetical protein